MADDFTKQLLTAMQTYNSDVQTGITEAVTAVGNEAKRRLRETSPSGRRKGSKKYRSGWRTDVQNKNGEISVTVHNKQYQLTHLLENGHKKRNGKGVVPAQPHIAPVEQWAESEAIKAIEKAVKG